MILEPFYLWSLVGIMNGIILGLAGAGGGIITIPILMYLGGMHFKDASSYSLLALAFGAFLTWLAQKQHTIFRYAIVIAVVAACSSKLTLPLKTLAPAWAGVVLLDMTCLFSLYTLWGDNRHPTKESYTPPISRFIVVVLGAVLSGFLSTMTGLGGGVFIIPWLVRFTSATLPQAMATSLLSITGIAFSSAYIQNKMDLPFNDLFVLVLNLMTVAFVLSKLLETYNGRMVNLLRLWTFTIVTVLSMILTTIQGFFTS